MQRILDPTVPGGTTARYNRAMHAKSPLRTWTMCAFTLLAGSTLLAQKPTQPPATPAPADPEQVIRRASSSSPTPSSSATTAGQFVANLGKNDFEVFEDGVKQRSDHVRADPRRARPERRQRAAAAGAGRHPAAAAAPDQRRPGRIFMIFVDDLHMDFRNTGRIRDLFKKISKELIHDGDMFGIVSTGPSSIADRHDLRPQAARRSDQQDLRRRPEAEGHPRRPDGSQGPPEVRYRAHVAFSTAYDILAKLEQVHNRRKAFIYVSNGYDFDPFSKSRAEGANQRYRHDRQSGRFERRAATTRLETNPFSKRGNQFAAADLASELSELTRQANRSNVTMYTIDPRGLVGGPDLDETKLDMMDWQDHIRETQSSLR